jgi:GAF domain-containing protein/HD superfamily phosphodiesterase
MDPIQSSEIQALQHTDLLFEIIEREYAETSAVLKNLVADVRDLYNGKWLSYQACQVGYHNFGHALDVTLAAARMIVGRNMSNQAEKIPADFFQTAIAATLFHDTGYIMDRGDQNGKGGKYTFNHVNRSAELATGYLHEKGWPENMIKRVRRFILPTDFFNDADRLVSKNDQEQLLSRIIATADLVAQMAAADYVSKINDLFEEFTEAYQFENPDMLTAKGVQIYSSAQELMDGTLTFYENYVLPRLEKFGRLDHYLACFFSDGRNPYQESIAANISYHYVHSYSRWRRLGEILTQLGIVSQEQISQAVEQQGKEVSSQGGAQAQIPTFGDDQLLFWAGGNFPGQRLGEILIGMKALDQKDLSQGIIAQILPPAMLETLSPRELTFLLQASILLQTLGQDSKIVRCLMELTADFMECEASSIRMIDQRSGESFMALATGALTADEGLRQPIDKSLVGWAYHHRRPVYINDAGDARLQAVTDINCSLHIHSVLMVPLQVNGECLGVLELVNKINNDFSEHENDFLACLVNILGFSLGNFLMELKRR